MLFSVVCALYIFLSLESYWISVCTLGRLHWHSWKMPNTTGLRYIGESTLSQFAEILMLAEMLRLAEHWWTLWDSEWATVKPPPPRQPLHCRRKFQQYQSKDNIPQIIPACGLCNTWEKHAGSCLNKHPWWVQYTPCPHFSQSDHICPLLTPVYRQLQKQIRPTWKQVGTWPQGAITALQDCFDNTNCDIFREPRGIHRLRDLPY